MIYRDENNLPVSVNDGMDSAVRIGVMAFTGYYKSYSILTYITKDGYFVRHPFQSPANNYKNFTRDNMLPLVAGLYAMDYKLATNLIKGYFFLLMKRCFFMTNSERDKFGSKKYPYPHTFYKDSNPNTTTIPFYKGRLIAATVDEVKQVVESRYFDGPDPLLPNHIWFLIKAAKLYYLYPFAIIGIPFFLITLIAHSMGNHNEENQMIAESYVNGKWALKLYKLLNKKWMQRSEKYWTERGEEEYHNMTVTMMEQI